jgi:PAS domain S-box-containing protein
MRPLQRRADSLLFSAALLAARKASIPAIGEASNYQEETEELFYQRVIGIIWVGIVLFPLFIILDYVLARQYLTLFVTCRIVFVLFCLFLLYLLQQPSARRHAYLISFIAYIAGGCTISIMIVRLGGYDTIYYIGILMVLVAYAAMLPLTVSQAILSSILLYGIYAVPILLFNRPSEGSLSTFFGYSFFFLFLSVLSVLQCSAETRARKRESTLRTELSDLSGKLAYYAQNLESEVDNRAKALEESELRYRELYENIIDMVLLIDHRGRILKANPRCYEILGASGWDTGDHIDFQSFVYPEDVPEVESQLSTCFQMGEDLKGFQFRVVDHESKVLDVECNARSIGKGSRKAGLQMVIRDISKRKRLETELLASHDSLRQTRVATIIGLAKLAEFRDKGTGKHLERIREYTRILTEELARKPAYQDYITPQYLEDISLSAILHDIGKVGVPDAILLKPGQLSDTEFETVKNHCSLGGDVLKTAESQVKGKSFLTIGKVIAYHHHEKWDGTGYPDGLAGDSIPLSTRLVALADVYDALTSRRSYKEPYSHERAREIILSEKGHHFDPDVVDAFLAHEQAFKEIRQRLQDAYEKPSVVHQPA